MDNFTKNIFPPPYSGPKPGNIIPDIFIEDSFSKDDDRLWVPLSPGRWSRPLCYNISQGYWVHLTKVIGGGFLSRHRHPAPVHGFVIKGSWRYLEHDWVAKEGSYLFFFPCSRDGVLGRVDGRPGWAAAHGPCWERWAGRGGGVAAAVIRATCGAVAAGWGLPRLCCGRLCTLPLSRVRAASPRPAFLSGVVGRLAYGCLELSLGRGQPSSR